MSRGAGRRLLWLLLFRNVLLRTYADLPEQGKKIEINGQSTQTGNSADELLSCYNVNTTHTPTSFSEFVDGKPTRSIRLQKVWWSRRDAGFPVTMFTQSTLERLHILHLLCRSFPGGIIAASIWLPLLQPQPPPGGDAFGLSPRNQDALQNATLLLEGLFQRMEALNTGDGSRNNSQASSGFGACSLRLLLLAEAIKEEALSVLMPINILRNAGMLAADTPLAAMVDVDLSISQSLAKHVLVNKTRTAEMVRRAELENILYVMPAWDTNRTLGRNRTAFIGQILATSPAEKATKMGTEWQDKARLFPFAFDRFVSGHNATNYPRWISTDMEYAVTYTKGYEPWFIMSRQLMPSYDTRFRGYYYNKLLNVRYIGLQNNFKFCVLPDVWLVHRPHEITVSSNVWYKIQIKDHKDLSPIFDTPVSTNGPTWREVFNNRSKLMYLSSMERLENRTYEPVPDAAWVHCKSVLSWWQQR
ncbi:hypothetical protein VaNZ11_002014 [Volvox africanus]|uniref:Glycosyl transferase CAP10 domain-containing protein n=1 Tax=Volvox africanus TaxID=51714 RepID=A0ABQ5RRS7_9CHLO|nr:hypothetical protein VaNZ11_002014 [Volvox africanus]